MKSLLIICVFIFIFFTTQAYAQTHGVLRSLTTPVSLSHVISQVVLDPHDKDRILFHTGKHVYDSRDFAASWELLFEAGGIDEEVISVNVSDHDPRYLLIVTTRKVYMIDRAATYARTIFERRGVYPLSFAEDPFDSEVYLIGTSEGCFVTRNAGTVWEPIYGLPLNARVGYVVFHPNEPDVAFVAAEGGLYRVDTETYSAHKVMTLMRDQNNDDEVIDREKGIMFDQAERAHVSFSLNDDRMMYFVFNGRLYHSCDGGERWDELPLPSSLHGLSSDVRILSDQDRLVLSSNDALWLYSENLQPSFRQLSTLPRARIHSFDLYEGRMDTVVVGVDRSLYYQDISPGGSHSFSQKVLRGVTPIVSKYDEVLGGENKGSLIIEDDLPSIRELQDAAITYALLATKRMKSWERRARLKSLLPQFSFDIDYDSSNNIDIDRGSTSQADIFLDGPDDEDMSFGFSFDWDFSELIWNDTETSIEIRERALVDQRDEILREVTRLYFEYKRLQKERVVFVELDPQSKIANEIRIEEIRAQLDALTGGRITSFYQR